VAEDLDELTKQLLSLVGVKSVRDLRRLSGGASRETWSFDGERLRGELEPMVLQRERAGGIRSGGGIPVEVVLIPAAAEHGVPVAPLIAADPTGEVMGAPAMVLGRLEGETIARKLLRDDEYADARTHLAADAGRALAGIHRIPTDVAPTLDRNDQLVQFRAILDSMGEPHPAFELGFRRLEATRPPETRTTVVHGDFRTGNLIIGPEGLRAVLDWELAHLGDPMEDLGWFCVRAWRFGSPHPAGGFGSYEQLLDAYRAEAGVDVDHEVVRWWEAVGTLKWGVMCMIQAQSHLAGMSRSVELAAIGRRVCENEHDLLGLLGSPLSPTLPPPPAVRDIPGSLPHDRPTAAELVEAVREYVERDVMGATEGRVQFHARVAVNVLRQLERELGLGPAQARAHAARLAQLGFADDRELAAAIRSGDCDDRWNEVVAAVHASVLDKLAVANPSYI
jgi:aminoglycoside phosphotransferase (APT) family kinase protein